METDGGGWTVIQRRIDGSVDFYRNWTDYKEGFGNLTGEFWLGLNKIYRLTHNRTNSLQVNLEDFENNKTYALYSTFNIGDSTAKYTLTLGKYNGTAGDSLMNHNGRKFTTKDNDNDRAGSGNCAITFRGGWWYNACYDSNLNGLYIGRDNVNHQGIIWKHWRGPAYSLKFSEMKVCHS